MLPTAIPLKADPKEPADVAKTGATLTSKALAKVAARPEPFVNFIA